MLRLILKCYILFIYFYACDAQALDRKEGSSCVVGEYNGTCISMHKCFYMIQVLADKKKPKICSFDGSVPIVCCPESSEFHVKNISDALLEPQRGVLWKNGRKAWDKCLDYIHTYIHHIRYPYEKHSDSKLSLNWDDMAKCHTVFIDMYVTEGDDSTVGELPFMALLGYGNTLQTAQWLCGGSLISETFILTAGHCISHPKLGSVQFAALGMLKRSDPEELWQRYSIKSIIPYPEYKSPSKYNDIALLETTDPVKFSWLVLPAYLPTKPVLDKTANAAGWGVLGDGEPEADVMQKVTLIRFTDEECSEKYPPHRLLLHGYNSTTQMCFGDYNLPKDTCQGDSGGPLFVNNGCSFEVIGVTSFGLACGIKGSPGIYTRVEHYVNWIESIVWP